MNTKAFNLTEEQRHALGSIIAHTVGFDCLDQLFDELHSEFNPSTAYKSLKPWSDVKIVKRVYRADDQLVGVLGKPYRNETGTVMHDYVLSNLD